MQPYMKELNLPHSRVIYRRNCKLIQTVMMNFKSDPRYKSSDYLCIQCLDLVPEVRHQDSQEALRYYCPANSDLRMKYNLCDLKQEAAYYREIIERRNQLTGG